jgi:hypothetical protein
MDAVRPAFTNRVNALGMKPGSKGYSMQLEAFMQGVLATATATGQMSDYRAGQIGFLAMVGRLHSVLGVEG